MEALSIWNDNGLWIAHLQNTLADFQEDLKDNFDPFVRALTKGLGNGKLFLNAFFPDGEEKVLRDNLMTFIASKKIVDSDVNFQITTTLAAMLPGACAAF